MTLTYALPDSSGGRLREIIELAYTRPSRNPRRFTEANQLRHVARTWEQVRGRLRTPLGQNVTIERLVISPPSG